jgi:hypothetical protein
MCTTLLDGSFTRDHWETFTSSDDASSSFSFSTSANRGFKGVATLFAMTKFSLASTKSKGSRNNLALVFERGRYLYSRN